MAPATLTSSAAAPPPPRHFALSSDELPELRRERNRALAQIRRQARLLRRILLVMGGLGWAYVFSGAESMEARAGLIALPLLATCLIPLVRHFEPRVVDGWFSLVRPSFRRLAAYEHALNAYLHWEERGRSNWWSTCGADAFAGAVRDLFATHGYTVNDPPPLTEGDVAFEMSKGDAHFLVQVRAAGLAVSPVILRELVEAAERVGGDAALYCSRDGFTVPAVEFAQARGLRLMDAEALAATHRRVPPPPLPDRLELEDQVTRLFPTFTAIARVGAARR